MQPAAYIRLDTIVAPPGRYDVLVHQSHAILESKELRVIANAWNGVMGH
jgi:hypothetical protein